MGISGHWVIRPGKWWTANGYGRDMVNNDGSSGRQHREAAIGTAEAGLEGCEGEERGWKCLAAEVVFRGRTQERMEDSNGRWIPIRQPKNCAFPATESLNEL